MDNTINTLWYAQPATDWHEALPLGNGRIGAMVFGDPDSERIELNEDTLWSGHPRTSGSDPDKNYQLYHNKSYQYTFYKY